MLKRRIILLMLAATGGLSSASFVSLLLYFDPYSYINLSISLLIISFILSLTSITSIIFYFFKKIYYRGDVGIYHIFTSIRQSFFLSSFFLGVIIIISFNIPVLIPLLLLFSIFLFLELFIRGL